MTGRSGRLAGSRPQSMRSILALPMATVTPIAQGPIAWAVFAWAVFAWAPMAQVLVAPVVSMALIAQVTRAE